MNTYNHDKIRDLDVPVIQVHARNEGEGAKDATFDEGGNLHRAIPICIGARVMLTENLWTKRGLVNGALRNVRDIQASDQFHLHLDAFI